MKRIFMSMHVPNRIRFEPVIHTPEVLDLVRADWRAVGPLVEWAE